MPTRTILKAVMGASLLIGAFTADIGTAAAQSRHYCDDYARKNASRHANGANVLGGAAGGAITGAIIGGIIDGGRGAGRGAAIGAGAGALGGALHQSASWQDAYNHYYRVCMRNARQRQPARANYRPQPWTDEWYDYCAAKYRSFNPETGRYKTYSGRYRLCR